MRCGRTSENRRARLRTTRRGPTQLAASGPRQRLPATGRGSPVHSSPQTDYSHYTTVQYRTVHPLPRVHRIAQLPSPRRACGRCGQSDRGYCGNTRAYASGEVLKPGYMANAEVDLLACASELRPAGLRQLEGGILCTDKSNITAV